MSVSPLPTRRQDMDFFEALKQVNDGNLITKLEWNDSGTYAFIKEGMLSIHFSNGVDHAWLIRDADMAGEDYVLVDPPSVS